MTAAPATTPVRPADTLLDALAMPPFGARTNGLPACSWVPLLDVPAHLSASLLSALREAEVPACVATATPLQYDRGGARVWVDAVRHAAAEDVTRRLLSHDPHAADTEGDEGPLPRPTARPGNGRGIVMMTGLRSGDAVSRGHAPPARSTCMDSTQRVNVRCSAVVIRNSSVLLLSRGRGEDWVLPGGTPRLWESVASCARREVAEETGLHVTVDRVAFVLEASNPADGIHLLDLVFTTTETDRTAAPRELERGLTPTFYPLEEIGGLPLRPPIAGHLRGLHRNAGRVGGGAYLGNVWRPNELVEPTGDAEQLAAGG